MTSDHSTRNSDTSIPGKYATSCFIPEKLLNIGRCTIRLSIDVPGFRVIQTHRDIGSFTVVGHHNGGTTYPDSIWPGVVSPLCSWHVEPIPAEGSAGREPRILKIN